MFSHGNFREITLLILPKDTNRHRGQYHEPCDTRPKVTHSNNSAYNSSFVCGSLLLQHYFKPRDMDRHNHARSIPRISLHRGVAFFIGQRAEEARRLSEQRITHSKVLVEKNMRHRLSISISVYGNGKLDINKPLLIDERVASDYKEYSNNVDEHLKSGYSEKVLTHWEKLNPSSTESFIKKYNEMIQPLQKDTVERIIQRIKKELCSFVDFDEGERPVKLYISEKLFQDISYALQYYLGNNRIFDIDHFSNISQEGNKWKLSINTVFAESDNKEELTIIQSIIKAVLSDVNTIERLEKLRLCRKNAENELQAFKEELTKIIKLVENGIPLEGKCEICKNLFKTS